MLMQININGSVTFQFLITFVLFSSILMIDMQEDEFAKQSFEAQSLKKSKLDSNLEKCVICQNRKTDN